MCMSMAPTAPAYVTQGVRASLLSKCFAQGAGMGPPQVSPCPAAGAAVRQSRRDARRGRHRILPPGWAAAARAARAPHSGRVTAPTQDQATREVARGWGRTCRSRCWSIP